VPLSPRSRLSARPRRARVAMPSPVPSSGLVPSRRFWLRAWRCGPVRARPVPRRPDASRPCSMPLASLESSLQSFPLSRSRARSREPVAPLRVRVRRPPARPGQACHTAFAVAPTLCHGSPGGSPDAWARTTVSRGARSFRRACMSTSTATDRSSEPGSPVNRRHARFEALLPPRVRSPISPPWPG